MLNKYYSHKERKFLIFSYYLAYKKIHLQKDYYKFIVIFKIKSVIDKERRNIGNECVRPLKEISRVNVARSNLRN